MGEFFVFPTTYYLKFYKQKDSSLFKNKTDSFALDLATGRQPYIHTPTYLPVSLMLCSVFFGLSFIYNIKIITVSRKTQ